MHFMHKFSRSFEGDRCFCERVGWKHEWFTYKAFNRNVQKPYHSRCHEQFQNSIGQLKNGIVPEVKAWSFKISETLGWSSTFNAQQFTPVLCGHKGSDEQRHSWIPPYFQLLEVVNSFLLQQMPPISVTSFQMFNVPSLQAGCCVNEFARRLSEHTTSFFSMKYFEPSFLLRIKLAKELLDFVLGI